MVNLIQKKKTSTTTTKSSLCSVNILDLFLSHPIPVLVLGILGFVGKGAAPLIGQLARERWRGFFSALIGLMGCLLQAGARKLYHQVTGF
jgi:hypothetical protein